MDWHANTTPALVKLIDAFFHPVEVPKDIVESLRLGEFEPKDTDYVIISVRIGIIRRCSLKISLLLVGDAKGVLEEGMTYSPENPKFNIAILWKYALPMERTKYLEEVN